MDKRTVERLDKVLALADSSHDGEALAAVRKARELLTRDGLRFGDLARAAGAPGHEPLPVFAGASSRFGTQIFQLRRQLLETQEDLDLQTGQLEFWRRRAIELEHNLNASHSQTDRWRQLARETVDMLWDLARSIRGEEGVSLRSAGKEIPAK